MCWLVDQILGFVWIGVEIEELPGHHAVDDGLNQLMALVFDAALIGRARWMTENALISGVDLPAVFVGGFVEQGGQAMARGAIGHGDARQFKQGGVKVEQIEQRLAPQASRHAGTAHDKRNAHAVVVEVLLAHEPVLAHAQAVIRGIDDDGVVAQSARVQRLEDAADIVIHVRDHAVVIGDVAPDFVFSARVAGEQLVADVANADIEGVFGQEVWRQCDFVGIVHGVEWRRRRSRIMRRGEGDVGEERLVVMGAALVEKIDHFVGEDGR